MVIKTIVTDISNLFTNLQGKPGLVKEHSFDESNIIFLEWHDKESESELEESGTSMVSLIPRVVPNGFKPFH